MTRIEEEKTTVRQMIEIYCHSCHNTSNGLCEECSALLGYAFARLDHCPHGEKKPTCKVCPIHCYKPAMREQMRQAMRYAGPRMIWHHPISAIRHIIREMRFATLLIVFLLICTNAMAQQVEHDFMDNGHRHLSTNTMIVFTPKGSLFPISMSLNYYDGYNPHWYIRLYSRHPIGKGTSLSLTFANAEVKQLSPIGANTYHNRLGLGKMKTIYDVFYTVDEADIDSILSTPIVTVKIDSTEVNYKKNRLGKFLSACHKNIVKKLEKQQSR